MLIDDAKVPLTGWNARPEWGLFYSIIGTIKDIVFLDGESPNSGDFPSYVLVDFPQYKGPCFDVTHPTYVPMVYFIQQQVGCQLLVTFLISLLQLCSLIVLI